VNRSDPYMARARELATEAGLDPEARIGEGRGKPVWTTFRDTARQEHVASEQATLINPP
jgi:tRNA-splicing ligase RtcB